MNAVTAMTPAQQMDGPQARADAGKQTRSHAPRSSHGDWQPQVDRPDPVKILLDQAEGRVQELLPLRYGRMLVSPFSFYRGAAAIMASDLAATPTSGLQVQLCGDAHLSNFGTFSSPERALVFDISDFDETLPGAIDVSLLLPAGFAAYGRLCGWTLARAHARAGDRIAISAYLGPGEAFDQAAATFAECYADQNQADYDALQAAVTAGRVKAAKESTE